jgi:hypothetical protein
MCWHTECKDLLFQAIVLEILAYIALIVIRNEEPVPSYLTRRCKSVKVLKPFQT